MLRRHFQWGASIVVLSGLYMCGLVAVFIIGSNQGEAAPISGVLMMIFGVVGLAAAIRGSRRQDGQRRVWRLVSVSFIFLLATLVLFAAPGGKTTFPAPADATRLGFVVTLIAASYCFPMETTSLLERRKTTYDALTVAAGASMVLWYLLVGPVLRVNGAAAAAAALYAIADLLLLFGFVRVLLRGVESANRRPIWLLATAVLPLTASDAVLGYSQIHGASNSRTSFLQLACIMTMTFLMSIAAVERGRDVGRQISAISVVPPIASKLPYLAVAGGWTLMIIAAAKEQLFPWAGLVSGGLAITGLVILRQITVQRASEAAASTDGLTGLANRSHFHLLLAHILKRSAQNGRATTVLLIDMNGFKQVNDTFGHKGGDRLLSAFGHMLKSNVRKEDAVGRLGGDEFAVVLHDVGDLNDAEAVLRRISAAAAAPISIDGKAVRASASIGVALSRPGELNPDDILHRADVAMYDAKRGTGQIRWTYWDARKQIPGQRILQVEVS